jgi:hypothetical protein
MSKKHIKFALTLLPHQIFIMPQSFELLLNDSRDFAGNIVKYKNNELR